MRTPPGYREYCGGRSDSSPWSYDVDHVVTPGAGPAGPERRFRLSQRRNAVTSLEHRPHGRGQRRTASMSVGSGSTMEPIASARPPIPRILADIELLGADLVWIARDTGGHGCPARCDRLPAQAGGSCLAAAAGLHRGCRGRPRAEDEEASATDAAPGESFASVLEAGLGRTICRTSTSHTPARSGARHPRSSRRLRPSAGCPQARSPRCSARFWSAVPGVDDPRGRFFYPRNGYGQISDAYCRAARAGRSGRPTGGTRPRDRDTERDAVEVQYERHGQRYRLAADHVWSTIPVTVLARCCVPPCRPRSFRPRRGWSSGDDPRVSVLEQVQFSEYDAHYFPEADIAISRPSEPKNYSASRGPSRLTVCARSCRAPPAADLVPRLRALGRLTGRVGPRGPSGASAR